MVTLFFVLVAVYMEVMNEIETLKLAHQEELNVPDKDFNLAARRTVEEQGINTFSLMNFHFSNSNNGNFNL